MKEVGERRGSEGWSMEFVSRGSRGVEEGKYGRRFERLNCCLNRLPIPCL